MADTKGKSASEALINAFGSFPIGYIVGIAILPLFVNWIQTDPLGANIAITSIFASVSFVRTYFLRRIFDKYGFDDNLVHLCKGGFAMIKNASRRQDMPLLGHKFLKWQKGT
jgi:hypothetical protein